ncbi:MAG TPA: beta-L-arabinofuranosidase domain-containing protein [Chthonomonadales bacterium]|nr:beta-L-arabinofuranosidase domain-containing protein [Chthonomonadales bacterium]
MVVDTSGSPAAALRPLPTTAVQLQDGFWMPRLERNRTVTIPSLYRQLQEKGRLESFERASGKKDVPFPGGYYFNDADVYKWLEAACWSLAGSQDDSDLRARLDQVITEIADAQEPTGYVNTYFSRERAAERWTNFDLHEMYCAGHLFQAAIAHVRATGSMRLMEVALSLADHICDLFGPEEQGKQRKLDAHPEVEMALVELYRATGRERYLNQAQFFIDARGHGLLGRPYKYFEPDYAQDNAPFRQLDRVTGHAVRMMYLDCGATDVYAETGEAALRAALDRQWANMTQRRLYVTGGVGARGDGEAFGKDYQLPSAGAYAETCAAIGAFMWNYRLLLVSGEARYADMMERILYNGMLAGLSLDGASYFYENPLSDDGSHRRQEWFDCACCPPNVARTLAALPGYFASTSRAAVWLHLYAAGAARASLPSPLAWNVSTNYPWSGDIAIEIVEAPPVIVAFHLRIPEWCPNPSITINGRSAGAVALPGDYAVVAREWRAGDTIELDLPMAVRTIAGHPNVVDACGRVALMRGPLVYCIESADHPGCSVQALRLPKGSRLLAVHRPDLLGGVYTLEGEGASLDLSDWECTLYRSTESAPEPQAAPTQLTAVPYYAWANRAPGPMEVWIPVL